MTFLRSGQKTGTAWLFGRATFFWAIAGLQLWAHSANKFGGEYFDWFFAFDNGLRLGIQGVCGDSMICMGGASVFLPYPAPLVVAVGAALVSTSLVGLGWLLKRSGHV